MFTHPILSPIISNKRRAAMMPALVLSFAISLGAAGCAGKKKTDEVAPTTDLSGESSAALGDSDSNQAMGLKTVNFPYDAFNLTSDAKSTLKSNAQILKDNSSVAIQIEGHCDSRGGIQYNIALGEKRANAVKSFLEQQGIKANRLSTISYGKERLLDQGTTEEAHAKNRRANFVITSK